MKAVKDMTAEEYKQFLLGSPEEAKKLDNPEAAPVVPVVFWRNGILVEPQKPVQ